MPGRKRTKIELNSPAPSAEGTMPAGLREEIAMLRRWMARIDREGALDEASLADLLRALDGLGKAGTRLAGLLKAQRQLDESREGAGALTQALEEVLRGMED